MSLEQEIIEIIAEQALLEPQDVNAAMSIEELGMDSLALVETIFAIEEKYNISVPFNANDPEASDFDISSVKHIIDGVQGLIDQQKG